MKIDKKIFPKMQAECVNYNLRKAVRHVSRIYDDVMKPSGLTAAQFFLLGHIYFAENQSIAGLSAVTDLDRTTLSRNLKTLEKMGLVELSPGVNLKTKCINLTEKGISNLRTGIKYWQKAQNKTVDIIGADRWKKMKENLSEL